MSKLKILLSIIILLCIIYLGEFLNYYIMFDQFWSIVDATQDKIVLGRWNFLLSILLSIGIFVGLTLSAKCVWQFMKLGFFTEASQRLLRKVGFLFLTIGIVSLILDIIRITNGSDLSILTLALSFDVLLLLVSIVVLIIADMAQTGYQLKSENNLTI